MDNSLVLRNCVVGDVRGVRDEFCDIVVHGGRIAQIGVAGAGRATSDDVAEIDARGAAVVPGFVNMHAHLSFAHPRSRESAAIEGEDPLDQVLRMAGNARKALGAGVTTMRLVGEFDNLEQRVRDAIVRGHLSGPRIFTAGAPLTYADGHGASVGALEADSTDGFAKLAAEAVANGVDLLKLMICSGIAGGNVETVRMREDEFLAIRDVARAHGLRLAVHAAAVDHPITNALIDDGVDTLEHCYTAPPSIIDRCVEREMLLVPTPLVTQSEEYFREIEIADELIAEIMSASDRHWSVVVDAVSKGAKLALGTDFQSHLRVGGTWAVVHELELFQEAGVKPLDLLGVASRNGAVWLGLEDSVGLVEEGFVADLLVVGANPFDDASAFRKLNLVVAEGRTHPVIPPQMAAHPVAAIAG